MSSDVDGGQIPTRLLPPPCISFTDKEGKLIFREALDSEYMGCFFKLMPQLPTQNNPTTCRFSCLVMILNALEIDPGIVWKYPWRWFREDMLDSYIPRSDSDELTFDQFSFVASCNSLNVVSRRLQDGGMTVDEFRNIVKQYTQRDDVFVVLSYSRSVLDQTGDGHFSPIGGYHPGRDLILILDTARFKYPPHWVPVQLLYDAMNAKESQTDKARGFMLLSRCYESRVSLFCLSPDMSPSELGTLRPGVVKFVQKWMDHLDQGSNNDLTTTGLASQATVALIDSLIHVKNATILKSVNLDECFLEDRTKGPLCCVCSVINGLENTLLFTIVTKTIELVGNKKLTVLETVMGRSGVFKNHPRECKEIEFSHFLTFFILCWPYNEDDKRASINSQYRQLIGEELQRNSDNDDLILEVNTVRTHLKVLMDICNNEVKR